MHTLETIARLAWLGVETLAEVETRARERERDAAAQAPEPAPAPAPQPNVIDTEGTTT
jgi:hypothetical protein